MRSPQYLLFPHAHKFPTAHPECSLTLHITSKSGQPSLSTLQCHQNVFLSYLSSASIAPLVWLTSSICQWQWTHQFQSHCLSFTVHWFQQYLLSQHLHHFHEHLWHQLFTSCTNITTSDNSSSPYPPTKDLHYPDWMNKVQDCKMMVLSLDPAIIQMQEDNYQYHSFQANMLWATFLVEVRTWKCLILIFFLGSFIANSGHSSQNSTAYGKWKAYVQI